MNLVLFLTSLLVSLSGETAWSQIPMNQRPIAIVGEFSPRYWELKRSTRVEETALSRFQIDDADAPGHIRFQVNVQELKRDGVSVKISVGRGTEVNINAESIIRYVKAADTIEVPYSTAGQIRVTRAGEAPGMILLGIVRQPMSVRPEYKFSARGPRFFNREFLQDSRRQNLSMSLVKVEFDAIDHHIGNCTGFQFAKNYFLTNFHCIKNELRANDGVKGNTLVFGATAESPDGTARVPATFVGPLVSDDSLDYAVLRADEPIPSPYNTAVLELETHGDLKTGTSLELYQQWTFEEIGGSIGKALSDSTECRAYMPEPDTPGLCVMPSLMHKCDTEPGTSGSPILLRGGQTVVALHFLAIRRIGNCAIEIGAILKHMRQRPELKEALD